MSGGRFDLEMPPGQYVVSIDGQSHVPHQTQIAYVDGSTELPFSVLQWGPSLFGATYDETFHRAFHQIARVSSDGIFGIRKWAQPPSEIYLVEGTVPASSLAVVREVLEEISQESLPALWCESQAIPVTSGPEPAATDGRVVVRPNWDITTTGTLGRGVIRSGTVQIQVFMTPVNRSPTYAEFKGALLHEFYHVAFGYHLCGGNLGPNPFGFSRGDCPYPESSMANRGPIVPELAPQDRLAACIVYNDDTHVDNRFPDINARYAGQ